MTDDEQVPIDRRPDDECFPDDAYDPNEDDDSEEEEEDEEEDNGPTKMGTGGPGPTTGTDDQDPESELLANPILNNVYNGNNLDYMRAWHGGCVDMVYLDPPFKKNKNFNGVDYSKGGAPYPVQEYTDMWKIDPKIHGRRLAEIKNDNEGAEALIRVLSFIYGEDSGWMAYIAHIVPRLYAVRRLLKDTGVCFIHCDNSAQALISFIGSHIFKEGNRKTSLIWARGMISNKKTKTRWFPKDYDVIHAFTKTKGGHKFHPMAVTHPTTNKAIEYYNGPNGGAEDLTQRNQKKTDKNTESWYGYKPKEGRVWCRPESMVKAYKRAIGQDTEPPMDLTEFRDALLAQNLIMLKDGHPTPFGRLRVDDIRYRIDKPCGSVILPRPETAGTLYGDGERYIDDDVPTEGRKDKEYDYPTRKPWKLIKRLILSTTDPDDVILDPYAGSGATILAAKATGRKWIAIDFSENAIMLCKKASGDDSPVQRGIYDKRSMAEAFDRAVRLEDETGDTISVWNTFQRDIVAILGGTMMSAANGRTAYSHDQGIDGFIVLSVIVDGKRQKGTHYIQIKGGQSRVTPQAIQAFQTAMTHRNEEFGYSDGIPLGGTFLAYDKALNPHLAITAAKAGKVDPRFGDYDRLRIMDFNEMMDSLMPRAIRPFLPPEWDYKAKARIGKNGVMVPDWMMIRSKDPDRDIPSIEEVW